MSRNHYSHNTASKIRTCIKANPGSRAKNIAKLIGLRRETVNSYLYSKQSGALGNEVMQDENYGWHLKETLNNVVQNSNNSSFLTNTKQSSRNLSHSLNREVVLTLSLEEAFRGGQKRFQYHGEWLTIDLPAGTRQYDKLRVSGKGEYDTHTSQQGDLYLKVKILPHECFQLNGDDVLYKAVINSEVANYGGEIKVLTLDGEVNVHIPSGIHSGQHLSLKGKGWLSTGSNRGNQLIQILVEPSQELKCSVKEVKAILHQYDYSTLNDNEQKELQLPKISNKGQSEQLKQKLLIQTQGHSFMVLRTRWFWLALLLGGILSLGTLSLINGLRSSSIPPVEENSR